MSENNYTAKNIRVLKGLEAVRMRPGMYIGSTSEHGLHQLVYEVVDNSIDEALANRASKILVELDEGNICTVTDDGSGIPVEEHPQTHKSTLETVLTVLHAGGKFDNDAYQISGGLHGVGVSVVNALSEYMIAEVKRNGHVYQMKFERGTTVSDLKVLSDINKDETGTKITFKPDGEIFDTVEFKREILIKRFREMAFLNKEVKIHFIDRRNLENEENFIPYDNIFYYEGGIKEFVEYLNQNRESLFPEVIYFNGIQEDTQVEIAMQYTDSYSENIHSYCNNIFTSEGGTHLSGFKSALTRAVNDYARKYSFLKEKEENLTGDDIREGLTLILSVKIKNPQFEGQTKAKLGNSEVRGAVDTFVYEKVGDFLEENPSTSKIIIEKSLRSRKAREAARRARDITRKRSILDNTTLPGKLADSQSTDINENEIFLVEGNSAGGSAKLGRDNKTQAILPLRGKIMNVEKATLDRILGYEEIQAMITAFGTGIGEDFDIKKLRYGKIIIMTDADVDGAHIRTLLLTFFYRYMRPLVDQGHVYIAQPPLYRLAIGKNERYVYDDKEMEKVTKQLQEENKRYKVSRYKGLGEMNADQLWETTMNPEHRILLKVSPSEDDVSIDQTFSMLMGNKVAPRREFIQVNAKNVENLDV